MDAADVLNLVQTGGAVAALALFLAGFRWGWWFPGAAYTELKTDRDFWRQEAIASRTEVARLNAAAQSEVIPALVRVTDLLADRAE